MPLPYLMSVRPDLTQRSYADLRPAPVRLRDSVAHAICGERLLARASRAIAVTHLEKAVRLDPATRFLLCAWQCFPKARASGALRAA